MLLIPTLISTAVTKAPRNYYRRKGLRLCIFFKAILLTH
jgi:hypothetical protein